MKKKLAVKSLLYWLLSISLTHGAVKIHFTSPVHLVKNIHHPAYHNSRHHKSINEMRLHIKKVLNMHLENSTVDNYITSTFNLNNANPTYVFRLPDKKNRTLSYRKSDFSSAIFPNITNVNKFTNASEHLESSSSIEHQVRVKNEDLQDELKFERFIFENNINHDDIDRDEDMKKIVEENVRSEKEFIELMNELNEDLEEEDLRAQYKNKFNKPSAEKSIKKPLFGTKVKHDVNKKSEEDQWDELGLSGWTGTVSVSKSELPKKDRPSKLPKKINTALVPIYQNFDPFAFLKFPSQNKKAPNLYSSSESTESSSIEIKQMEELSDQLSSFLLEDEKVLLNKTGRLPNNRPRWPITTTRDKHGDNDVFLARSNNPFGHSTKWKYNNATDLGEHREGRSKRGVFHLYSMIKCATGCDPLVYKGYGCFCGFLGSGRALDGIDRCCKAHDYCYGSANCLFYTEYFVPYLWKCYRGKPLCAIDNGEWGGPNSCATRLCECDRALSRCLRHYYCPKKRPVCSNNPFRLLQNLVMVF